MDTRYTPVYPVLEEVAVNALFTGGANEVFDENMKNLAESEHFKEDLLCHLI